MYGRGGTSWRGGGCAGGEQGVWEGEEGSRRGKGAARRGVGVGVLECWRGEAPFMAARISGVSPSAAFNSSPVPPTRKAPARCRIG